MKTLDLTTRFANSDRALPLLLQAIPFFIEKGVGKQGQAPKAHKRSGTHELILVQAELFLAICKEDFDVPARRDVLQQPLRRGGEIAGRPIARLRNGIVQRTTHDDHLARVELAHACRDDMHVHRFHFFATRPAALGVILSRERGGVRIQSLPPPSVGLARVLDAQAAITLETRGDEEAAFAGGFPDRFGPIPTVQQDVRQRLSNGFKVLDQFDHEIDLALERHLLSFADGLLPVETWWERTTPLQKDIQPLNQAMSTHPSLMGR